MYLTKARIGPMEGGPRDGEYVEADEIVSADTFREESIPLLLAAGVLVEATDERIAARAAAAAEANGENAEQADARAEEEMTEVWNVSNDSNGN